MAQKFPDEIFSLMRNFNWRIFEISRNCRQISWFNNGKNGIYAHLRDFYLVKLPKNLQKYKNLQIMIKITSVREKWRNTCKWRKFSLTKVFTTKFSPIKTGNRIKYLNENETKNSRWNCKFLFIISNLVLDDPLWHQECVCFDNCEMKCRQKIRNKLN